MGRASPRDLAALQRCLELLPRLFDRLGKLERFEDVAPELLSQAVYGLTELNREAVRQSKLIANPGCFPESALLALAPAVKAGIIGPEIIIDSKTGISGAGRGLDLKYHFGEAAESVSAYGLSGHRHLPEIVQDNRTNLHVAGARSGDTQYLLDGFEIELRPELLVAAELSKDPHRHRALLDKHAVADTQRIGVVR